MKTEMEVLLNQITAAPEKMDCENNNEFTLDVLESEPGYYEDVIRPLLVPGHEGELICFLQTLGLIPQYVRCNNADTDYNCKKPLSWLSSRTIDNYQWKCLNCKEQYSIRKNSIFRDVKCNFKDLLRIVLGWCKGKDKDTMMNILGVRKPTINFIYKICVSTAMKYMQSHINEWRVGGPNVVVIVDIYPDGYRKFSDTETVKMAHPILCIAEVKNQPPRYWFEVLSQKTKREKHEAALNALCNIILPGSVLVCDSNAAYCSYAHLQTLKHLYTTIVTIDSLERHNNFSQNVLNNLETIWQPAMYLCEAAQTNCYQNTCAFLIQRMWQQRFGRKGFEVLVNHFCDPEN